LSQDSGPMHPQFTPTSFEDLPSPPPESMSYQPVSYEPQSYEPHSYQPQAEEPQPEQTQESDDQPQPKKKSFMDDDDDDELFKRAAALKNAQKSNADKAADEAFRKAAEADGK